MKRERAPFNKSFKPSRGGHPVFLDWSFEPQFNSTSHTLSETIGKWVLRSERSGRSENIVSNSNHR